MPFSKSFYLMTCGVSRHIFSRLLYLHMNIWMVQLRRRVDSPSLAPPLSLHWSLNNDWTTLRGTCPTDSHNAQMGMTDAMRKNRNWLTWDNRCWKGLFVSTNHLVKGLSNREYWQTYSTISNVCYYTMLDDGLWDAPSHIITEIIFSNM